MRGVRIGFLILLALGLACRSAKTVLEPGAVLLHVKCAAGAPIPDWLLVWVYDDNGVLWGGERIPAGSSLLGAKGSDLGTILIQPGVMQGALRVHIRGFASLGRTLDGVLSIPTLSGTDRTFDVLLTPDVPADADGDDVPDPIDDCPGVSNPDQNGCPDAGGDGPDSATSGDEVAPLEDATTGADRGSVVDAPPTTFQVDADEVGTEDSAIRLDGADVSVDGKATDSGSGSACDDAGSCGKSQGVSCGQNDECASGYCADGVCCTNACAGPCRSCNQPSATGVCQGYAAGSDPELECTSGATCNGVGACGTQPPASLPNGQLCIGASQCSSGFCKDGVCCNTGCTDACQACGTGTCLTVKRSDDVPECSGTSTCNQKGICVAR